MHIGGIIGRWRQLRNEGLHIFVTKHCDEQIKEDSYGWKVEDNSVKMKTVLNRV